MNDANMILIAIGVLAGLVAGWVARKFWASKGPTEKALALKVLTAAIQRVAEMNTTTPEQAAVLAAEAAKEAALIAAAKDAVSKL